MNAPIYLMNPATGSVDTADNWRAEMSSWSDEQGSQGDQFRELVEVRLADGSEVPSDFNPARSNAFDWVEVD